MTSFIFNIFFLIDPSSSSLPFRRVYLHTAHIARLNSHKEVLSKVESSALHQTDLYLSTYLLSFFLYRSGGLGLCSMSSILSVCLSFPRISSVFLVVLCLSRCPGRNWIESSTVVVFLVCLFSSCEASQEGKRLHASKRKDLCSCSVSKP